MHYTEEELANRPQWCKDKNVSYVCTQPKGHTDDHAECSLDGDKTYKTWPNHLPAQTVIQLHRVRLFRLKEDLLNLLVDRRCSNGIKRNQAFQHLGEVLYALERTDTMDEKKLQKIESWVPQHYFSGMVSDAKQ